MVTVEEINKTFAEKGLYIELPLPPDRVVKGIEVLEKRTDGEEVKLLLKVKFIDEMGKEVTDILFCQGKQKEIKRVKKLPTAPPVEPTKSRVLPTREKATFEDEAEALAYLREAIADLLQDKGYCPTERSHVELYFEKEGRGFFVNLAVRCDDEGFRKAKELVELRRKYGSSHDYGLVVPAFQESLGLPLRLQDQWLYKNEELLSAHRIGVYAVDNADPNRIYPLTVYPGAKELVRYFMFTSQQWQIVRSRYVQLRGRSKSL